MKFKSKPVKEEENIGGGRIRPGQVAWIAEDDAARVHPLHAAAIAAGHHVPKDPKEIENAQKRLDEAEAKENRRRGIN